MAQWLMILSLFVHNSFASSLYDKIDDYHFGRRGIPSIETEEKDTDCIKDILVVWDNSQSVGLKNFEQNVRPFLKSLIVNKKLNVGEYGSHIGFITFASDGKTENLLEIGSKNDKNDLLSWLDNLDYVNDLMGPSTYTGKAFKLASDEFRLRSPLNHRKDVSDVILLITDGEPRARNSTILREQIEMANEYSAELMDRKVLIVALAVGPEAKEERFVNNIVSWSNHMFTSGFDDLDKVLGKIVKESCSVETVYCDCDGEISTEQYVRPGEDKIMMNWLEPSLRCTRPVDYTAEVKPHGTQNPQEFGLGTHIITYEFSYYGGTDKLTTRACFVDITVHACECPSVQTITATVEHGQPRAFVSWWEPEPYCPNTPSRGNPDRNHGWFTVGEHTMMYNYKHETYLQSFNIECHVNIIVTAA